MPPERHPDIDLSHIYAVTAASYFFFLLFIRILPWFVQISLHLAALVRKHLNYRFTVRRYQLLGPWSRTGILIRSVFVTANICCFTFKNFDFDVSTLADAGSRAGHLAVINLLPLGLGFHSDAAAQFFGMRVHTFRQIHLSAAVMSTLLATFHSVVAVTSRSSFPMSLPQNMFAVIGISSFAGIATLALPLFRRFSYEVFLRSHQLLALLSLFSVWRHIPSVTMTPRLEFILYIVITGFARDSRKLVLRSRAMSSRFGYIVRGRFPSRRSHPFVVISWAEGSQNRLDLLVEPRNGLTQKLLRLAKSRDVTYRSVMLSGPYGRSVAMNDAENILLIASDFGIAAQLPYLTELIRGYNARKLRARRINLVWQVRNLEVAIAAQSLLNEALNEDTLDDGWILTISIYCESENVSNRSYGRRAHLYSGKAPLRNIVEGELQQPSSRNVNEAAETRQDSKEPHSHSRSLKEGLMVITASATANVRDDLRRIVRHYLAPNVTYVELDYQPF